MTQRTSAHTLHTRAPGLIPSTSLSPKYCLEWSLSQKEASTGRYGPQTKKNVPHLPKKVTRKIGGWQEVGREPGTPLAGRKPWTATMDASMKPPQHLPQGRNCPLTQHFSQETKTSTPRSMQHHVQYPRLGAASVSVAAPTGSGMGSSGESYHLPFVTRWGPEGTVLSE